MDTLLMENLKNEYNNKSILITGGTGSFGKKMLEILLNNFTPKKIIIFSRDEFKQSEMQKIFSEQKYPCLRYFIGDIRDKERLIDAFRGIDIIFHAAALKQVPAIEYNPSEAIKTNIYGAENVIKAALYNNVKKVIAISTDKAVSPVNLYGATKLCFEKLFIAANNIVGDRDTKFSVFRYGNVLGSRGSVVPLFLEQSKYNKFTVTDVNMTRFNLTLDNAINFVLMCSSKIVGGEIFVPKLKSYNILQLCKVINDKAEIEIIGNRNGEKIHECMINKVETNDCYDCDEYFIILSNSVIKIKENFNNYIANYSDNNIKKRLDESEYISGGDLLTNDEIKLLLVNI
jgi:UDP-N-acetylglucosamine 4,6-dehydratase